jgi:hypothetical protein
MQKTSIRAGLAGLMVLLLPLGLLAQEDEAPPPLSDVWIMVVKPGMNDEFDEAMAAHMRFRKDAGESREWNAFRVVAGHNMKPIGFRSCCFEWADLDAHAAENDELGLADHFNANVARYVEHLHHYFETSDWANSHWPDEGTNGPYYMVSTWTTKQGAGPAAGEARKRMSQLALNEGWADGDYNWLWFSREVGDEKMLLVSSFETYEAMAPPEQSFFEFAAEQMGEEESAAVFDAFGAGFDDVEHTIWKLDESLSTPQDEDDD